MKDMNVIVTKDNRGVTHTHLIPVRPDEDRRQLLLAAKQRHVELDRKQRMKKGRQRKETNPPKLRITVVSATVEPRPDEHDRRVAKRRKDAEAAHATGRLVANPPDGFDPSRTRKPGVVQMTNRYMGYAHTDEGLVTGPARSTEDGATKALVKKDSTLSEAVIEVFDAGVDNNATATMVKRHVAGPADTGALVEPTAAELAELATVTGGRKRSPAATKLAEVRLSTYILTRNEKGDAVEYGGELGAGNVQIEAHTLDEAREKLDAQPDLELTGQSIPFRTRKPLDPNRFGSTPIGHKRGQEWYVAASGVVHGDGDCRFIRKAVANGTAGIYKEKQGENLVARIQEAGATNEVGLKGDARIEFPGPDGKPMHATGYCLFCAVEKPVVAEAS